MDISFFQKINNTYKSKSKQETELWLINRNEERYLYDNVDKQDVLLNGEPFELLVIKGASDSNKKIKSLKSTPFNLGDYVNWNNAIWLVTSLDSDDKVHHSGTMTLCTYLIAWQKPDGTIATRWAVCQDASKYDAGIVSNGNLVVPTGSISVTLPIDYETKRLKRDMRFVIDTTTDVEYADGVIPEVYVLSNRKTAFNNDQYFNRGGTISLLMTAGDFDTMKDKYVEIQTTDGTTKSVWVCDYNQSDIPIAPTPPSSNPTITATIIGSDETYFDDIGFWEVEFKDENGTILSESQSPTNWTLQVVDKDGSTIDSCIIEKDGLEISLQVTDDSLLGEFLYLQVILDDAVLATKKIELLGGF